MNCTASIISSVITRKKVNDSVFRVVSKRREQLWTKRQKWTDFPAGGRTGCSPSTVKQITGTISAGDDGEGSRPKWRRWPTAPSPINTCD